MTHNFLQVALGGAIGASARYGVNILAGRIVHGFPLGTLTVNILGCLAMGLLAAFLALRGGQHLAHVVEPIGLDIGPARAKAADMGVPLTGASCTMIGMSMALDTTW